MPYHALFGFDMITHDSTHELLRNIHLLDEPKVTLHKDDSLNFIRTDLRNHIKKAYDKN